MSTEEIQNNQHQQQEEEEEEYKPQLHNNQIENQQQQQEEDQENQQQNQEEEQKNNQNQNSQNQNQQEQLNQDSYVNHALRPSTQNDIVVYVVDPVVKDSTKNYVVYTVKGSDSHGPFEVLRRFSEFYALKETLNARWPGCFVPPVPEKKAVGNFDHRFVEERRKQLHIFMQQMSELPHLWNGEEVQTFLRSGNTDIDGALKKLPKQDLEQLIQKYEQSFSFLSGKEINTDIIIKISSFQNFIKKQIPILENYKHICKSMIKSKNNYLKQMDVLQGHFLPEYERCVLSEYLNQEVDGKLVLNDENNPQINEAQTQLKDTIVNSEIEEMSDMLTIELKELEAFQETLNLRAHYESKKTQSLAKKQSLNEELSALMSNKTTLKGIFSTKNKNQQIESIQKKIEQEDQHINNLTLICEIMTVLLGYVEIDRFKQEKETKYYNTVRKITRYELQLEKQQMEFWSQVLSNKHLL